MQWHVWGKKKKRKKPGVHPTISWQKPSPGNLSSPNIILSHSTNPIQISKQPCWRLWKSSSIPHGRGTLTSGTCAWRAQEVKGDGCLYKPRHRQGATGAAERSGISPSGGGKGKLGATASAPLMHYGIQHSPDIFIQKFGLEGISKGLFHLPRHRKGYL